MALTPEVFIPAFVITIIFWAICLWKVKLTDKQVPIMGLLTALFFVTMMMNYPVVGGTTAHLLAAPPIGLILPVCRRHLHNHNTSTASVPIWRRRTHHTWSQRTKHGHNRRTRALRAVLVLNKVFKERAKTVRHNFRFRIRR